MPRHAHLALLLALTRCAAPPAPAPPPPPAVASVAPPPAVTPPTPPAPTASDAGTDAPVESPPVVRASFALRPDQPPCQFVFHAGVGSSFDFGRYLMGVSRIEVEAGGPCAAHVVFDPKTEKPADPDEALDHLEGGLLPNPGKLDVAAAQTEGPPPLFVDANFDGTLDLQVVALSGAYNTGFAYWLFDPKTQRFVRSAALEELLMPRFDAKRKRVASGGRAGGPVYVGSEHEWVGGKLELVWSQTTYLGETPKGKPLPKGFTEYRIRYERKGGVQKKVFDGPAR